MRTLIASVLLFVAFSNATAQDHIYTNGTVLQVYPVRANPLIQAYLHVRFGNPDEVYIAVVFAVQRDTRVTLNGNPVTWRQLRPGDVVQLYTIGGRTIYIQATRTARR
jgi:hypothetical protein